MRDTFVSRDRQKTNMLIKKMKTALLLIFISTAVLKSQIPSDMCAINTSITSGTYNKHPTTKKSFQKRYTVSEVYDSVYGINLYEKFVAEFKDDGLRADNKGMLCQGWNEDFYDSGKLLHKGYYVDGKLIIYKNYYPNGQVERNFKRISLVRSQLTVYTPTGENRSRVDYYKGNTRKWVDYYPCGLVEYMEVYSKNTNYLVQRRSYFSDGTPESVFELHNKRKKEYLKKEFYETHTLKEEGTMRFDKTMLDFTKNGLWRSYDEKGNLLTEETYASGKRVNYVSYFQF